MANSKPNYDKSIQTIHHKLRKLADKNEKADLSREKLASATSELLGRVRTLEDSDSDREETKHFRDKVFTWAQNTYNEYYCGEAAQKRHERELDRFKARVDLLGAEYVRSEEADEAQSSKESSQYWAGKVNGFLSSPLYNSLSEGAQALWEKSVQRKLDPPQCSVTLAKEEAAIAGIKRAEELADLNHQVEMSKLRRQLEEPQPVDDDIARHHNDEFLKMNSAEEQLKYLIERVSK